MTANHVHSGDVSLYFDPSEGLRVECSEKHAQHIKSCLAAAGFRCGENNIGIPGTRSFHNWIEFKVAGEEFQAMKQAVSNCLVTAGMTVMEETFSIGQDKHVRLNLINVRVYDK